MPRAGAPLLERMIKPRRGRACAPLRQARTRIAEIGEGYSHHAFISFSGETDRILARRLRRALRHVAAHWIGRGRMRIFLDEAVLAAGPLASNLKEQLDTSARLILVASTTSAEAPWVRQEVEHWRATRPEDVLLAHAGDTLVWSAGRGDFDWDLTDALPQDMFRGMYCEQPLRADLTRVRGHRIRGSVAVHKAAAKLAAAILDVGPEALWRSERRRTRVALAVGVTAALLATGVAANTERKAENIAALRLAAAKVASVAREGGGGDGTGYLLAMASDDIAASAGDHTDVLASLMANGGTLVRILRPPHGVYRDAVVSSDGAYALLSTSAGVVQIVTTGGAVAYEYDYPPGVPGLPTQIDVNAIAFARDSQHAAIATSDHNISVLQRHENGTWAATATLVLPVSSKKRYGSIGPEENIADSLSFSPDGRWLVAFGSRIGYYRLSLKTLTPTVVCPQFASGAVSDAEATNDGVLFAASNRVSSISTSSCAERTVLTVPGDAAVQAVLQSDTGKIAAVATSGAQLLSVTPGRPPVTLATSGPYSQVRLQQSNDGRVHATATNVNATFGWSIDLNATEFVLFQRGSAATSRILTAWIHDGIAELHRADHQGFNVVASGSFFGPNGVAWAGNDLVGSGLKAVTVWPDAIKPPASGTIPMSLSLPPGYAVYALAAGNHSSLTSTLQL
jgi:WD40 repeat protein